MAPGKAPPAPIPISRDDIRNKMFVMLQFNVLTGAASAPRFPKPSQFAFPIFYGRAALPEPVLTKHIEKINKIVGKYY